MKAKQNWDDLRIFLAVAEAESIRGAARELGVDHGTVSRRLKALQSSIGVSLLTRIPEGYALTPEGEDMRQVARSMRDQVEALNFRLLGRDAKLTGTVRLTVSEAISELLAPDIAGFRIDHPGIRLEVVDHDTPLNLTKREADIAVRFSSAPPDQLVGRRVWRNIPFAPYVAAGLVEEVKQRGNIFEESWVDWDHTFSSAPHVQWLRSRVPEHKIAVRVTSTTMLRQMVRDGVGLGLIFCGFGEEDPHLARIGEPVTEASLDLWVLTHADLRSSARIRACMDMLVASLKPKARPFLTPLNETRN